MAQAVAALFAEVQRSPAQQARGAQAFTRLLRDPAIRPAAAAEFLACVDRVLVASKNQASVSSLLNFAAKCVTDAEKSGSGAGFVQVVVEALLSRVAVKDRFVRLHACALLHSLLDDLSGSFGDEEAAGAASLFERLTQALLLRTRDKLAGVRAIAARALARLQDDEAVADVATVPGGCTGAAAVDAAVKAISCPVMSRLAWLLRYDSSAEVRCAAVQALSLNWATLRLLAAHAASDASAAVRLSVWTRLRAWGIRLQDIGATAAGAAAAAAAETPATTAEEAAAQEAALVAAGLTAAAARAELLGAGLADTDAAVRLQASLLAAHWAWAAAGPMPAAPATGSADGDDGMQLAEAGGDDGAGLEGSGASSAADKAQHAAGGLLTLLDEGLGVGRTHSHWRTAEVMLVALWQLAEGPAPPNVLRPVVGGASAVASAAEAAGTKKGGQAAKSRAAGGAGAKGKKGAGKRKGESSSESEDASSSGSDEDASAEGSGSAAASAADDDLALEDALAPSAPKHLGPAAADDAGAAGGARGAGAAGASVSLPVKQLWTWCRTAVAGLSVPLDMSAVDVASAFYRSIRVRWLAGHAFPFLAVSANPALAAAATAATAPGAAGGVCSRVTPALRAAALDQAVPSPGAWAALTQAVVADLGVQLDAQGVLMWDASASAVAGAGGSSGSGSESSGQLSFPAVQSSALAASVAGWAAVQQARAAEGWAALDAAAASAASLMLRAWLRLGAWGVDFSDPSGRNVSIGLLQALLPHPAVPSDLVQDLAAALAAALGARNSLLQRHSAGTGEVAGSEEASAAHAALAALGSSIAGCCVGAKDGAAAAAGAAAGSGSAAQLRQELAAVQAKLDVLLDAADADDDMTGGSGAAEVAAAQARMAALEAAIAAAESAGSAGAAAEAAGAAAASSASALPAYLPAAARKYIPYNQHAEGYASAAGDAAARALLLVRAGHIAAAVLSLPGCSLTGAAAARAAALADGETGLGSEAGSGGALLPPFALLAAIALDRQLQELRAKADLSVCSMLGATAAAADESEPHKDSIQLLLAPLAASTGPSPAAALGVEEHLLVGGADAVAAAAVAAAKATVQYALARAAASSTQGKVVCDAAGAALRSQLARVLTVPALAQAASVQAASACINGLGDLLAARALSNGEAMVVAADLLHLARGWHIDAEADAPVAPAAAASTSLSGSDDAEEDDDEGEEATAKGGLPSSTLSALQLLPAPALAISSMAAAVTCLARALLSGVGMQEQQGPAAAAGSHSGASSWLGWVCASLGALYGQTFLLRSIAAGPAGLADADSETAWVWAAGRAASALLAFFPSFAALSPFHKLLAVAAGCVRGTRSLLLPWAAAASRHESTAAVAVAAASPRGLFAPLSGSAASSISAGLQQAAAGADAEGSGAGTGDAGSVASAATGATSMSLGVGASASDSAGAAAGDAAREDVGATMVAAALSYAAELGVSISPLLTGTRAPRHALALVLQDMKEDVAPMHLLAATMVQQPSALPSTGAAAGHARAGSAAAARMEDDDEEDGEKAGAESKLAHDASMDGEGVDLDGLDDLPDSPEEEERRGATAVAAHARICALSALLLAAGDAQGACASFVTATFPAVASMAPALVMQRQQDSATAAEADAAASGPDAIAAAGAAVADQVMRSLLRTLKNDVVLRVKTGAAAIQKKLESLAKKAGMPLDAAAAGAGAGGAAASAAEAKGWVHAALRNAAADAGASYKALIAGTEFDLTRSARAGAAAASAFGGRKVAAAPAGLAAGAGGAAAPASSRPSRKAAEAAASRAKAAAASMRESDEDDEEDSEDDDSDV